MVAERRGAALQQIVSAQQKDGVYGWPEGVPEAGECSWWLLWRLVLHGLTDAAGAQQAASQ